MAGYKSLLAIDNWQDALDTYKHNNPDARILCGDLSKINPEDIKREYNIDRVSVIIGGPPCQGFSIAGKRIKNFSIRGNSDSIFTPYSTFEEILIIFVTAYDFKR